VHARSHAQGFSLSTVDAEAMSRAAEDLIDSEIAYDPNFTPDQNFNMLVRAVRLLQVSLDLQVMRNEDLTEEVNTLNTEAEVNGGAGRPVKAGRCAHRGAHPWVGAGATASPLVPGEAVGPPARGSRGSAGSQWCVPPAMLTLHAPPCPARTWPS
jgi:hypothetical protein